MIKSCIRKYFGSLEAFEAARTLSASIAKFEKVGIPVNPPVFPGKFHYFNHLSRRLPVFFSPLFPLQPSRWLEDPSCL